MNIIAWTYDADVHCIACALERFGAALHNIDTEDSEGNPIHPIFSTDEQEDTLICGDCGDEIE